MKYSSNILKISYEGEEIQLNYLFWNGVSTETIICVHGLTRNAHDFDYLADSLSEKYNVISLDIPGRGHSSWLKNPDLYDLPLYIYCVERLLEHLNLQKIHWIGSSMGGLIGMSIAAKHKDLIKNLVLNDIGPEVPFESVRKISTYVNIYPSFKDLEEAELYLRRILQSFGIKHKKDWEYITKNSFFQKSDNLYYQAYDPLMVASFVEINKTDRNYWDLWHEIKCRLLVLRGTRSNILLKQTADKMKTYPNVQLVELPDVGHTPSLMDNKDITLIKNWLLSDSYI